MLGCSIYLLDIILVSKYMSELLLNLWQLIQNDIADDRGTDVAGWLMISIFSIVILVPFLSLILAIIRVIAKRN